MTNAETKSRQWSPCLANLRPLCCNQMQRITVFMSQQINVICKIFHNVNCGTIYVIYLMKSIFFNKQYIGKAKISFNIKLNDHQKDVKKANAIIACNNFQQESHNSKKQGKFTILDQLTVSNLKKLSPSDLSKEKISGF